MTNLSANYLSSDMKSILSVYKNGVVHSIFNSSVNLIIAENLITVLAAQRSVQPYSVVISQYEEFAKLNISIGDNIIITSDYIKFEKSEDSILINLNGFSYVELSIFAFKPNFLQPDNFYKRLNILANVILEGENSTESLAPLLSSLFCEISYCLPHNIWSNFLLDRVRLLYTAIIENNIELLSQLAPTIAGCGPGLTPSSDDFLTGIFCSIYGASCSCLISPDYAKQICKILAKNSISKTNIISAKFISAASIGNFNEDVLLLIQLFFSNCSNENLYNAAKTVSFFGSTSGIDILCGIYFGLASVYKFKIKPK